MSSIYDDSVLIQVPSGYGVGKLYSVIPNTPVGDFDVTRSSWTTRVNKYGYIENVVANVPRLNYDSGVVCPYLLTEDAGTNLITYPISFVNSYWTKSGASIEADSSTAGSELITNGNFESGLIGTKTDGGGSVSTWTLNTTSPISGSQDGLLDLTTVSSFQSFPRLKFLVTMSVGEQYLLSFDYKVNSGTCVIKELYVGGSAILIEEELNGSGTFTYSFIALQSGEFDIYWKGNALFTVQLDNVSVKQVSAFEAPKVLPVANGAELITNGDFATDSDWVKQAGWTISGGYGVATSCPSGNTMGQSSMTVEAGKTYEVVFTVLDYSLGGVTPRLGGATGTSRTANGTYTEYLTTSTTAVFSLQVNNTTTLNVDNVSVKEITTCSWSGGGFEKEAYKLVEDTTYTDHFLRKASIPATIGNVYTVSIYAKKGERTWMAIRSHTPTGFTWFDLDNGVVGTTSSDHTATITPLANGWYRCSITYTEDTTDARAWFYLATEDNVVTYTGDGTSGIYIAYAQLEENDYASSLILPANSVEGSTTSRVADEITGAGDASLFTPVNASGVLYAEIAANSDDLTSRTISISDGTTDNRVNLNLTNASNKVEMVVFVGGLLQTVIDYTVTDETEFQKVAVRYAQNDFSLWIDGVERATDTSGITFPTNTLNECRFDRGTASQFFYGKTKALGVFDYLYDDQMELLTGDSYATYEALAMAEDYIIL